MASTPNLLATMASHPNISKSACCSSRKEGDDQTKFSGEEDNALAATLRCDNARGLDASHLADEETPKSNNSSPELRSLPESGNSPCARGPQQKSKSTWQSLTANARSWRLFLWLAATAGIRDFAVCWWFGTWQTRDLWCVWHWAHDKELVCRVSFLYRVLLLYIAHNRELICRMPDRMHMTKSQAHDKLAVPGSRSCRNNLKSRPLNRNEEPWMKALSVRRYSQK